MPERDLKAENRVGLSVGMFANLAVFYSLVNGEDFLAGSWHSLARFPSEILPAGLGLVLTGILNAQLSADVKARVVFMRWGNPLPASEAFTRHAGSDPRVDMAALRQGYGPLPCAPREQNALWYRLYQSVNTNPAVRQAHRAFLFMRDFACLALFMVFLLGGAALFQAPSTRSALIYIGLLVLQFVLAARAARTSGQRFVTTVLAIKAAERQGGADE